MKIRNCQSLVVGNLVVCLIALCPSIESTAVAQQTSKSSQESELKLADQASLVQSIYESTKTAKSPSDYSRMLELCDRVLGLEDLRQENRDYVSSLSGWALNRRGELRLETAKALKAAGNGQFQKALQSAIEDCDRAVIAAPSRYRSWMSRGIAYAFAEDYKQALDNFSEVLKVKPDHQPAWFNRAEVLYELGRYPGAEIAYGTVLRLNSTDVEALTGRAHCRSQMKKWTEALADYDRVIELSDKDEFAILNRGDALLEMGNHQLAYVDYESAYKKSSSNRALQRLAWMNATCQSDKIFDPTKALSRIKQAMKSSPETPKMLETLAAAEAAAGDFNAAKQTQNSAIQLASGQESDEELAAMKVRLATYASAKPLEIESAIPNAGNVGKPSKQ